MAEKHDNTKPASAGTISISRQGTINYFPVEEGTGLKPSMALCIHEKTDGSFVCCIDTRWSGQIGEIDE